MTWTESLMRVINRIASLYSSIGTSPAPASSPESTAFSGEMTPLEERQQLLRHHIRLVARRDSLGAAVFGAKGGCGKTRVVLETLRDEHVRPVILNGHCTPLSLYTTLFNNPDSIIVCDDCEGLSRNLSALGILRSALWGETRSKRLVTYNSSQLKIPQSFHFSGGIILILNTMPANSPAWDAVLSRVDQFELTATNEEVVELMRRMARKGFEDKLTAEECSDVVDFIAQFATTRDISLRLLHPSYRKVLYSREAGCNWQDLVKSQLVQMGTDSARPVDSRAFDLQCLREALAQNDSVRDAEHAFISAPGKSRATFYRLRHSLNEQGSDETRSAATPSSGVLT